MWDAIEHLDLIDKGFLPLVGGSWDQPAWLMQAYRVWKSECSQFEAEAWKID